MDSTTIYINGNPLYKPTKEQGTTVETNSITYENNSFTYEINLFTYDTNSFTVEITEVRKGTSSVTQKTIEIVCRTHIVARYMETVQY